ncbi:unnamed protein product [Diatraea saccharalis]|uniref:PEHE domain-containing protein n=1 Tax=Diatraea saccharalis TaxID=40085 RepID=A0A9N9WDM3_9NEOP|nr:unnamed protein product [Diatraea saccharalis]
MELILEDNRERSLTTLKNLELNMDTRFILGGKCYIRDVLTEKPALRRRAPASEAGYARVMAPALSVAPGEPHSYDNTEEIDQLTPLRRRALASVDNLSIHMEEDDMGLQSQPSLAKDSQEMEQILVDLGSSDLAQADLLQAIKTFESGDGLSTGDPDGIFPLSAFDLPETADSEGDAAEDKIRLLQARLERRCSFLQRRLRILQARSIGKRISEEAAQTFDKCIRGARKDGGGRPIGLKAFLKRIETTAVLQASAASRSVAGPKYYHASCSHVDPSKSASVGVSSGTLTGLEDTAGALRSHLSVVKHELDSDATASSSGAESNDEAVTYNNPHQQPMPIEKRALWSWQRSRASIASRWCWLQAQVQELEYKIRQHTDLHKQVREAKGPVEFEGEPVAYEGSLPGSDLPNNPATQTCARVRPLKRETFKKRKLLQMHNLHIATTKAAKPSDICCSCEYPLESCGVCTGRAEPTMPEPPPSTLPPAAKLARADPAYHPVLSDVKVNEYYLPADIRSAVHMSALSSRAWFRARARARAPRPRAPRAPPHAAPAPAPHAPHAHHAARDKRHSTTRSKRGRPPLSRKTRERDSKGEREDETATSGPERSRGRQSTESRTRRQSYDIDNIVIPQSIAANTRPQILTYKEIITPKWRVLEIPEVPLNNGVSKSSDLLSVESEEEDISEAAVRARHVRAEQRERGRYARKPRHRRVQEPPPPSPPAPAPEMCATPPPAPTPPPPAQERECVRPYSPRQFPLPERTYEGMVADMPQGFYQEAPPSPPPPPREVERSPPSAPDLPPDEYSSDLSPLSNPAYDGDDPDDAEWEPSAEKTERRKSSLR